jgi:acyl carrier protein
MEVVEVDAGAVNLEDGVRAVLMEILQISDPARLAQETPLLGSLPEFDSMAVVGVLTGLEERYGIDIDDDEVTAEIFATVRTLIDFLEGKLNS